MASKRMHQAFDLPPPIPKHTVSVEEWDATMRAALTGIIAEGDRSLSYEQAVAHARVYADAAHGPRPGPATRPPKPPAKPPRPVAPPIRIGGG